MGIPLALTRALVTKDGGRIFILSAMRPCKLGKLDTRDHVAEWAPGIIAVGPQSEFADHVPLIIQVDGAITDIPA